MDTVRIRDLAVDCVIGALPEERDAPQRIWIDAELHGDLTKAGQKDELELAWDYSAAARYIADFCKARKAQLIETLALGIARLLLDEFPVQAATVRVRKKPAAMPEAGFVEVELHRSRA